MTPDEMARALETAWEAHRTAERKIAALEGDLRAERAKRGAAETLRDQTIAQVRTDRARSRIEAALVKAGANAQAATDAAEQILASGAPEFDAAGDMTSVAVKGERATSVDKIAGRAFESMTWLARSKGTAATGHADTETRTAGEHDGGLVDLPRDELARRADADLARDLDAAKAVGKVGQP